MPSQLSRWDFLSHMVPESTHLHQMASRCCCVSSGDVQLMNPPSALWCRKPEPALPTCLRNAVQNAVAVRGNYKAVNDLFPFLVTYEVVLCFILYRLIGTWWVMCSISCHTSVLPVIFLGTYFRLTQTWKLRSVVLWINALMGIWGCYVPYV